MASRTKVGLAPMHTAGIFSDMTVDGPEIGTLVVIVDRAKNLPNRKTIGKQDPYCAARLGKEAKKTETDIRGGQTPKWDQELRFIVHDSPDYDQMKVSVFNDDKKTDLIGETWIGLKDVIVSGGGQNDLWHNLQCKGKYAGEIRIEITFYDSRPKQPKTSVAEKHSSSSVAEPSRQSRSPVKRRPLPSDPTAGTSPGQTPDHSRTPPRGYQTPEGYISSQSPLQTMEYNTPTHSAKHRDPRQSQPRLHQQPTQPDVHGYSAFTHGPPGMVAYSPTPVPLQDRTQERYEIYDPSQEGDSYIPGNILGRSDGPIDYGQDQHANNYGSQYNLSSGQSPPSPGGPPPPPPAHRSLGGSPAVQASYRQDHLQDAAFDDRVYSTPRQDVPRQPRQNYSQGDYQAYSPPKYQSRPTSRHQEVSPRHQSFDDRPLHHYEPPSVEDASPPPDSYRTIARPDNRRYDVPSPAPLNLSGRGSAASGRQSQSSLPARGSFSNRPSTASPLAYREQSNSEVPLRSSTSQQNQGSQYHQQGLNYRQDHAVSPSGYVPPLPSTLIAGMDPIIAQEVSDRIYHDTQIHYNQSAAISHRRYGDSAQQRQAYTHSQSRSEVSQPYASTGAPYGESQPQHSLNNHRTSSPNPSSIPRKSVSPAPVRADEPRRLSGVPFGPDDYAALNPNITPVKAIEGPDPEAKIIMHDGRVVDPSDHLPEHSWAPEPEARGGKQDSQEGSRRPPFSGAQPMPPSGRRQLRVAPSRPQAVSHANSSPVYMSGGQGDYELSTPGRRLQRKTNRPSAQPAPYSSPLAPIDTYDDAEYNSRSAPRGHSLDYGENGYSTGSPHHRGGAAPPVPAKVPMQSYGSTHGGASEENAWALLEEMKSIDLGSGKARRKNRWGSAV